jgi:alpha-glucosidase
VIDLYQAALRDSAACRLMVDFHGANKPAGESRTWPNEMTREGILGLEHRNMQEWPRHNTTLPFTRMLAGHADYTVMHFGDRRRDTSWAHQIASAVILTSPLLVYAAHPKNIMANPAVELIRSVPSVWDETIVLRPSEIGELAIFARRRSEIWFLAIMNGPSGRTLTLPLSFLVKERYQTLLGRDQESDSGAITMEQGIKSRRESLEIKLRAGGGFVARLSPTR